MTVSRDQVLQFPNAVAVLQHLKKAAKGNGNLMGHGIPYVESYLYCDGHYVLSMRRTPRTVQWTEPNAATMNSDANALYNLVRIKNEFEIISNNR